MVPLTLCLFLSKIELKMFAALNFGSAPILSLEISTRLFALCSSCKISEKLLNFLLGLMKSSLYGYFTIFLT